MAARAFAGSAAGAAAANAVGNAYSSSSVAGGEDIIKLPFKISSFLSSGLCSRSHRP